MTEHKEGTIGYSVDVWVKKYQNATPQERKIMEMGAITSRIKWNFIEEELQKMKETDAVKHFERGD